MADFWEDGFWGAGDDAVGLGEAAVGVFDGFEGGGGVEREGAVLGRVGGAAGVGHVADAGGGQEALAVDDAGQVLDVALDVAAAAFEEDVAGAGEVLAADLFGEFFGFVDVDFPEVAAVLRAGLVAEFAGDLVVVGEGVAGGREAGGEHDVGVAALGGPGDGALADRAGDPDRRVRLLQRAGPGIDVAVVVVLALPAEGAGLGPGFDDEVVRLLVALPVVGGGGVVRETLAAGAAHPAGDQASAGDHVDLRQRLRQPERVVPDRQDVAEQADFGALGDAGEDRGFDIDHGAHAEGRRVVLVEHDAVEAGPLGGDRFIEIAVVEIGSEAGIVFFIGGVEVGQAAAGAAPPAGLWVLVRAFGEPADEHPTLRFACLVCVAHVARVARPEGIEPPTARSEAWCSVR